MHFRGPRKPSVSGDSATTAIPVAPTVDLDALENPADVDLPSPMVPETADAASEMSGEHWNIFEYKLCILKRKGTIYGPCVTCPTPILVKTSINLHPL